MAGDREYIISSVRRLKGRYFKALLGKGDNAHTVNVSGKANYVWVRVKYGSSLGAPVQALNRTVPPIHGRVVRVKEIDRAGIKGYEVVDFDDTGTPYYQDTTGQNVLPKHGWTHECSQSSEATDPVNLYTRCWAELRVEPTDPCSMHAYVTHGWYMCEVPQWFPGGNTPTFTAPAAGTSRYDLVYIDCSGTVGITQGENNMPALGGPLPEPPNFTIPLAAVLFTGSAGCIEEDMILDCRVMPNLKMPAGSSRFDDSITPAVLYPDTAPWPGAQQYPARADHRHGIYCTTAGSILAQDTVAAEGTSSYFARADHTHALDVGVPSSIASANAEGGSTEFVRKDHAHQGVHSLSKSGDAALYGDITLSQGANIILTQLGQDIAIASTASGGGGGSDCTGTWVPVWEYRGTLATMVGAGAPERMLYTGTVQDVWLVVEGQGSAGQTIIDINKNGATIFTDQAQRPTVNWDDGDDFDIKVPAVTTFHKGDEFTVDFDSVATDAATAWVAINTFASHVGTVDGAPIDAEYVVFDSNVDLTNETSLYSFYGKNLVRNSPGQIVVDGAEPQWWDDVANATLTDEDTAGEGIPDKHERVFKCVTTANDVYGYQTLAFADEELLDAGQTVISFSCWVYCASANKASIGIYGTNLGLQESSQAGAGAWELLTIEGITLNAADASIQIRLIVDTGTAYFTMPMLNVGPKAMPWQLRMLRPYHQERVQQLGLAGTTDVAWTNTDCTANTDPLAARLELMLWIQETAFSGPSTWGGVGLPTALCSIGGDKAYLADYAQISANWVMSMGTLFCDDSQIVRYTVNEQNANSDVQFYIQILAYWRWE
jgi:hypothetical protein